MASFNESIVAYFGGDTSGLEKAVIKAEGVVGGFQSALGKIGVTLGGAAVLAFFKNVVDQAGRIDDLSKSLGISTDAVQSFEFAIQKAGGKTQDIQTLFERVRGSLDELAVGNEKTTESFRKLGLSQEDLVGIPLENALEKVAAGYVENKNEAGAYSAVIDIAGAKSAKLMGILEDLGANGLGKFNSEIREANRLIAADTISRLDELGDSFTGLGKTAVRIGAEIVAFPKLAADTIGALSASVVNYFAGIKTEYTSLAGDSEKAVAAIQRVTDAFSGTAATLKDFATFREAEFKRELDRADIEQDSQRKINLLKEKARELAVESGKYEAGTKENLEIMSRRADVLLQIKKEQAKVEEVIFKNIEKQDEQHRKTLLSTAEEIELAVLLGKNKDLLTRKEKERLEVLKLLRQAKAIEFELSELLKNGADRLTDGERKRVAELLKQGQLIDKQIKGKTTVVAVTNEQVNAEGAVTFEVAEQARLQKIISDEKERQLQIERSRAGIIDRKGMEPEQLTDTQLQAASDRLRAQLSQFRQQDAAANRGSTFLENYRSPLTISAEQELQRIQKEQELRRSFNITVQNQGVNVAERTFSPTEFNRLQALYGSELQKNTEKLSSIESTLNAVFKKR